MDREHVTVHRSVVSASILQDSTACRIRYQTAGWLREQLAHDTPFLDRMTMKIPGWRRCDFNHTATVEDIYALATTRGSGTVRSFLTKSELQHVHEKLGDIRALDHIAQYAPAEWSFRPTTCECTSKCRLGKAGVPKRTYSCGSEHVIVRPTASHVSRHLNCFVAQRRTSQRKLTQSTWRWFHQEFVEGLQPIGHFQVFVVTVKDATATRGRSGEVIEVVHTLELKGKELVVTVLTSGMMKRGTCDTWGKVDLQQLKRFALYVFEALRRRPDWLANFESLEVGA